MTTNKENFEEEYGADSEWLIPLYTNEVSIEDKKTAVRTLIQSTRADERKKLVEVVNMCFRKTEEMQFADEMHCGCLKYCEHLIEQDLLAKISQV